MEKRIYQLLKRAGMVKSSTEAQVLLDQGRVKINGVIVHSLKYKVNTKFQQATVDDKPLQPVEQTVYIILNKPKGSTCQAGEKSYVLHLITTDDHLKKTLFVVGRLDWDSEGVLIITNDGKLAHRILSPEKNIPKTYEVLVEGIVTPDEARRLASGVIITLELDGRLTKYRTRPAKCIILRTDEKSLLEVTVTEGKKRQVRKMCEVLGHKVIRLTRTKIGNLSLESLTPGEFIYVTREEIERKLFG